MKNIKLCSSILLIIGMLYSCTKDEIQTYEDTNNIYFSPAVFPSITSNGAYIITDSTGFSFGFDDSTVKSKKYRIPIRVQGNISDKDREVKVSVDPLSTAILGTHFELPQRILLRAGKPIDTIDVTVFRTPDLKTKAFTLILNLEENEFFKTKMQSKIVNTLTKKTLNFTKFKLSFDDKLAQPTGWFAAFLGVFTAKKFFLMCDLMALDPKMFNQKLGAQGLGIADISYYQNFMKRYLADQKALGKIVYEDDGTEMFFP